MAKKFKANTLQMSNLKIHSAESSRAPWYEFPKIIESRASHKISTVKDTPQLSDLKGPD